MRIPPATHTPAPARAHTCSGTRVHMRIRNWHGVYVLAIVSHVYVAIAIALNCNGWAHWGGVSFNSIGELQLQAVAANSAETPRIRMPWQSQGHTAEKMTWHIERGHTIKHTTVGVSEMSDEKTKEQWEERHRDLQTEHDEIQAEVTQLDKVLRLVHAAVSDIVHVAAVQAAHGRKLSHCP